MKRDKSCIDPFYEKVYNNLKSSKKKEKFKEVAPAAEFIPIPTSTSSLLDDVEEMLKIIAERKCLVMKYLSNWRKSQRN